MEALMQACAGMREGTCRYCSTKTLVYRDNRLCEDCDSRTIYCAVCRRREHEDNPCRHVFKNEHCEWHGAGYDPIDPEMERPFHRLLSSMGEDFARELKDAIKSRRFHTWLVAPMIGGGGMLELHGFSSWHRGREYGDRLLDLGERERDELADGYHWLASLYNGNTTKANRTTIAWIDRWLWPFRPHP